MAKPPNIVLTLSVVGSTSVSFPSNPILIFTFIESGVLMLPFLLGVPQNRKARNERQEASGMVIAISFLEWLYRL